MSTPNRNTLTLVYSGLIVFLFFLFGLLDILDYIIAKVLLFSSLAALAFYLIHVYLKKTE
jgi:hypothetical protein